jgi:transposase
MKSELYVGLDVDKEWIVITVAEWGRNGAVQDLGAISNDLHALEKLLARLRKRYGPEVIIRACYEAGPCGFTIARRLRQLGVECEVVAPSLTPTRAGDRLKIDKRDARKLARLLRAGELTEIYVPEPTDEALRDLCRARSDAVDDRSRGCGIIGSKRFCCGTGIVTREKAPGAQRTNVTYANWCCRIRR